MVRGWPPDEDTVQEIEFRCENCGIEWEAYGRAQYTSEGWEVSLKDPEEDFCVRCQEDSDVSVIGARDV